MINIKENFDNFIDQLDSKLRLGKLSTLSVGMCFVVAAFCSFTYRNDYNIMSWISFSIFIVIGALFITIARFSKNK